MNESEILITNLPLYLQKAINDVLKRKPKYKTKKGALGNCVKASDELLIKCDELLDDDCDGYLDGTADYKGFGHHYWAVIEGYCIDLTARQFDENEKCPKIYKNINHN
jgi:hypothetical protein